MAKGNRDLLAGDGMRGKRGEVGTAEILVEIWGGISQVSTRPHHDEREQSSFAAVGEFGSLKLSDWIHRDPWSFRRGRLARSTDPYIARPDLDLPFLTHRLVDLLDSNIFLAVISCCPHGDLALVRIESAYRDCVYTAWGGFQRRGSYSPRGG